MTQKLKEIEQEVHSLPVEKRNQLLRNLIADLDGKPEEDAMQEWLEVAERRYKELKNGQVKPVPVEQVIKNTKMRLENEG